MNELMRDDLVYVISTEEILWGGALLAVTIVVHGLGMLLTMRTSQALEQRFKWLYDRSFGFGVLTIVVCAWMIVLVNLVEIMVWAGFYIWQRAIPNPSVAFYYALVNYTTLDSGYLPRHWRLLEGVLAMAGLLTFAWSTGVLVTLAQQFQQRALRASGAKPGAEGQ
jgi:hypothetical protein